jgi:hypothetical protein
MSIRPGNVESTLSCYMYMSWWDQHDILLMYMVSATNGELALEHNANARHFQFDSLLSQNLLQKQIACSISGANLF